MGKFQIEKCEDIEGLYLIQPTVFGDSRGYFMETYNYEEFKEAGLDMVFVQDNQSSSTKGVLRGLHYQKNHTQGKLVRVLSGEVYDVAVDIRKGSKTYGKWFGVTLSAEKKNMFYIPEGFAHGFYVLSDTAEFAYKCILFLLIIDAAIYNTTVNEVFKDSLHSCCLVVTIAFSILCILVRRYSIKELLAHVSILLLAVMSYIISGNTDMFASILLVVLAWKLNIDDILKMIFSIRFVVFISVVLLSLVGVLKKGSIALTSADKGVLFGYGHANTFAGSAGILIFLMFAICRNNLKKIHFVIAVIADLLIFYFSRARTSLLLMTALVFILLMCKYVKNMDKVILKVAKYFQSILLIIIFGLIFLRAKEMMPRFVDMVDKLMNGRILLSAMNLAYYPVTLIGQKVDLSLIALDNQYYALDNGFVYILIHYGILGSLIIAGFQQKAIMKCIEKKDVVLTTICILILFWMVYEGMMVSATSNFTLLFAGTLIGTDKLKQKE